MIDLKKNYKGKKVLVTGHTGFKGSWLVAWLNLLGAKVVGISKGQVSQPSHFNLLKIKSKIKLLILLEPVMDTMRLISQNSLNLMILKKLFTLLVK